MIGRLTAYDVMDVNLQWLQQRLEHYQAQKNDMCEAIEDLDDMSKLG